ncbi:MAG: dihydrodipicolinate synthase family protein, partial [Bacilli bacterium]
MFIGSGVALVTPMHEDGSINIEVFYQLIDFHIENKTDAIIVAGTTGESSTLSEVEHMELVKLAVEYANARIPIIAGTGSNDTNTALELSLLAQEYKADAILLINPYYNKSNRSGLIAHFKTVADALSIPIILYNVPGRTGQSIPVEV